MIRKNILAILFAFSFLSLVSQIPAGYYDNVEGLTGDELKEGLHDIIKNHVEFSYNDLRDFILKNTDEDPDNSDNVILLYSGRSQSKSSFGGNPNDWNREHVWAKSHGGFGNSPPAGTDAHHIRPTDVSVNSSRGNLDFDMGGSAVPEAPGCYKDSDSFEPRDAVKGDVARMIFYMAVRYEGGSGEPDLEVVDMVNTSPDPEHGKLSELLLWNEMDPPDDFEMNRNDVIYYQYQNNRNPFIDHPEYVDMIWGDPTTVKDNYTTDILVYPIPANGYLNVEFSEMESYNYIIVSSLGRTINTGLLKDNSNTIDIQLLNNGLYYIILTDKDGNYFTTKFVKTSN